MEIGELTEKFEQEAKAIGYELMAVVSYNPATDRHQINWNDTAPKEIRDQALEGLALCFMKLADEDPQRMAGAIARATIHTKKGADYWVNALMPTVEQYFYVGIVQGLQAMKEDQEEQEEQNPIDIGGWADGE